jgi:hypothetical protein
MLNTFLRWIKMNNNYSYAVGYYDGRAEGVYNNPYEDREMSHSYKMGYDRGVADFCHYEECAALEFLEDMQEFNRKLECGK